MVTSGQATMGQEEFDYFIVSSTLRDFIEEVSAVEEVACRPHSAVRLKLRGLGRRAQVRVMCPPVRFALEPPPPVTLPPEEKRDWQDTTSALEPRVATR